MTRARLFTILLLFLLSLAACGGDDTVGRDVGVETPGGGGRLGIGDDRTTTTEPPATTTTARAATTTTARATTTTQRVATTRPTVGVAPTEIAINSDTSGAGSQFEPRYARVFQGGKVAWVNKDSVVRSAEADRGEFNTPNIAPGGRFEYTANLAPGVYNYHDGTRPYAVAQLEVLAR